MNVFQKRKIKKHLSQDECLSNFVNGNIPNFSKIKKICLFVSFQTIKQWNEICKEIYAWQDSLKCAVTIFCYSNQRINKQNSELENVFFIGNNHFSFLGNINSKYQMLLQKEKYDLLFMFSDKKYSLPSVYLQSQIDADFRIGNQEHQIDVMNMVLSSTNNSEISFLGFMREIQQYITILAKENKNK